MTSGDDGEQRDARALISINIKFQDFLGLSKPANRLAKAIERGVGTTLGAFVSTASRLAQPFLRKLDAEADSAALVTYVDALKKSGLVVTNADVELQARGFARLRLDAVRHQVNRETVSQLAITDFVEGREEQKTGAAPDSDLSSDWLDQYWRFAEAVSDLTMQRAWARVLAREASRPGTFSLRCLAMLSTMSRREAELIAALARMTYEVAAPTAFGVDHGVITSARSSAGQKWTKEVAASLEARLRECIPRGKDLLRPIGIVTQSGWAHTVLASPDANDEVAIRIADRTLRVRDLPMPSTLRGPAKHLGNGVELTEVGWEIMQIVRPEADERYIAVLVEIYETQGCTVSLE